MTYLINNGVVEYDNVPISSEELYKQGRLNAIVNGEMVSLIASKRPAELHFHFYIDPEPHFTVSFKGELLDTQQLNSLTKQGYFVANAKRIHFVNSEIKAYVDSAFSDLHLPSLFKLLRTLSQEGLCEHLPSNLLEALRTKSKRIAHHEKLFVQELYPYQKQGVDWLSFCVDSGVGTILADDMGLGKTAQIIALCCDVLEKNSNAKILIVVPNPLLDNWIREFAFFAPQVEPYLHYGTARRGVSSALLGHNVVITPYTTMASDISMLEELYFDLAVFDEASMLKNPNSGRSSAVRRLDIGVAVAMSGTPVENNLMDAWSLSDLVFPLYLGSQEDFKSRYVHRDLSETLSANLEELEASLRQITLRRMKKDVLEQLPEKLDIHLPVSQTESEKSAYDNIIEEMQNDPDGSGILPLINKLQQFTAHPALLNPKAPNDVRSLSAQSAKFELMLLKLDAIALSTEKVIIFATFQKAIDLIKGAVKEKYGITAGVIDGRTPNEERQPLIDDFSSSEGFDVLILHPRTAGMGLNITAASHVIHYCRQWNPALEEQATARAWRNGQKSVVSVYYMYYANTIEETIDERIRLKQQLSDRVVSVADEKETDKQIMLAYLETLGL
ncbi:DEAD/DEAH box helicase [Vibrio alginolyticus]|uniref:DEAD/DEAH box helicase n=1 Tax=Vibrio alginolyticus TaxID=663 RepID=UPI00193AF6EF|nr:DEAD/DEAH box helicase [Vibrio alginolyticus]EII5416291.1 DEAD/DEAH box helicase [Vibrio alginolyticus]ELA8363534.1 DEAD/DEAH box helicase [Vibrio alginolyticus]